MSDIDAATGDLERKLATIVSADVAGYSRLMAEDEEGTLQTFRGHKDVFERLVVLHRGRIFNTAGDAILAEFGSAVEAVRCATEIQAALRTRNDQMSEERQVRFRIGVNLGDVMVHGADLLGDGVNVAARLQTAAEPGGICIAGSVYDQIRNKLSLSIKPLGEMSYKNIPQPVRTFAIAEADGLGALPAPANMETRRSRGFPLWPAITAVLLLIAAGGGLWSYSYYQRTEAKSALQAQAERFDGSWSVILVCPKASDGALPFTLKFTAVVKEAMLHGEHGLAGQPGWLSLTGRIQPNGASDLEASGLTGQSNYNINHTAQGAPFEHDVTAHFDTSRGTGNWVYFRTCDFTFRRQ
jgi:class 3 adenylate cyclase